MEPQIRMDASVKEDGGLPCVDLCTADTFFPSYDPAQGWPAQAPIALSWRYATVRGR